MLMTSHHQIRQRQQRDGRSASDLRRRRRQAGRLSGAQVARHARHELAEITGLRPEKVTGLEQRDEGGWGVTVELLELRRVPETDDLIGSYEAELDEIGHLLTYHRVARYGRCQLYDALHPSAQNDDGGEIADSPTPS
jgi:hypothetical protein